ncbi:MAG: class I SAM-dependent methyltransferase [Saprospiraceae bacterium]
MIDQLGLMDIYLIDQLQKGRIKLDMKILDAGCGHGRNSEYFIRHGYNIYGIDKNEESVAHLLDEIYRWNPAFTKSNYAVANLNAIPFPDDYFDFIISSAVLHFAESRKEFVDLFNEHIRVLKKGGFFFFRMTSKHTIEHLATQIKEDIYCLPDESTRYLLDQNVLKKLMLIHNLVFVEPFKTVNVADVRTMSTVVLMKK